MALAAICPHCGTTFRVASDQLKLRGGIVRCGACHQVFDGAAALVDPDAVAPLATSDQGAVSVPDAVAGAEPAQAALAPPAADEAENAETADIVEAAEQAEEADPPAAPASATYIIDFDTTLDDAAPSAPAPVEAAPDTALPVSTASAALPAAPLPATPASIDAAVDEHLVALPPPDDDDPFATPLAAATSTPPPPPPRPRSADSLAPLLTRASAAAEDRLAPPAAASAGPATLMHASQAKAARRKAAAARKSDIAQPVVLAPAPPPPPPPPAPVDDEPEFVRAGRQREASDLTRRRLLQVGVALLALVLLAQAVLTFRNVAAARFPASRPVLAGACALLGCKIELPAQIDALAVETGELQTLDAGADASKFVFTTLLRNQGELVQAWPHLELALTDANDKTLVRRVFAPVDYLPPGSMISKGFAPRSEQAVKLVFQLDAIKASGYHLAIFYP